MLKRIILILALIFMIVLPVFSQTGNYTSNEYFYLPLYGAYGMDEYNEYNLYMEKADNQIETNKSGIGAIDLSLYYLKTEINTQAKVEAIWDVSLVNDGDLDLYYLKTEIDTQGEVETIWEVTLSTDAERNALTYSDIGAEQADAGLTSLAGLTYASESFIKAIAEDTYAIRTIAEMKTDLSFMTDLVDDTTPELGGEMDAGAHSIGFTLQTATGDGTTTIDWKLGNKFEFTFGAQNDTFTFTAPTNVQNMMMWIIQDATGSRTITWPGTVRWPGGTAPTLTTTANAVDIVSFAWNGTNYDGVASLAFATP